MLNRRSILLFVMGLVVALGISPYASAQSDDATGSDAEITAVETESSEQADDHSGDHDADEHGDGGHGAGGHGDELDPTHMNMSDSGEDPAEWRSEKAIATLIVFGLLLAGLTAIAWKPISEGLEKRERGIADNISTAEKAASEATAKLSEYEAKLASANEEAQRILSEARKDAEASGQRLIADAQEEAARQRERAVAEIESAKRVAMSELAEQSTNVAMTLAQRVVGREVNAGDHQNLIQEMLANLPSKN